MPSLKRSSDDERLKLLELSHVKDAGVLANMMATLTRLEGKFDDMDHVIRGNGAPGLVQRVGEASLRLETIEGGRNRWRDAFFTAGGGLIVGVITVLLTHLIH